MYKRNIDQMDGGQEYVETAHEHVDGSADGGTVEREYLKISTKNAEDILRAAAKRGVAAEIVGERFEDPEGALKKHKEVQDICKALNLRVRDTAFVNLGADSKKVGMDTLNGQAVSIHAFKERSAAEIAHIHLHEHFHAEGRVANDGLIEEMVRLHLPDTSLVLTGDYEEKRLKMREFVEEAKGRRSYEGMLRRIYNWAKAGKVNKIKKLRKKSPMLFDAAFPELLG